MAYTSQGTIDVEFSDGQMKLHFVPEQGYSNKHKNTNFAIFVRLGSDGNGIPNAIIREYDPKKDGVEITVEEPLLDIAVRGASQQIKVEVQVVESGVNNPAGIGAGVPAPAAARNLPSLKLTGLRIPAR